MAGITDKEGKPYYTGIVPLGGIEVLFIVVFLISQEIIASFWSD